MKRDNKQKILEDEEQTQNILSKAKRLLAKFRGTPVIGRIVDDIADTIKMIKNNITGRYTVPTRIIVLALGGILYIISPVDIIPDFIPLAE